MLVSRDQNADQNRNIKTRSYEYVSHFKSLSTAITIQNLIQVLASPATAVAGELKYTRPGGASCEGRSFHLSPVHIFYTRHI
jgi:hypothetical protein